MPDISMCRDFDCPKATTCYRSERSGTRPNMIDRGDGLFEDWQCYFADSPRKGDECPYYRRKVKP
jgi:hypothetical protein